VVKKRCVGCGGRGCSALVACRGAAAFREPETLRKLVAGTRRFVTMMVGESYFFWSARMAMLTSADNTNASPSRTFLSASTFFAAFRIFDLKLFMDFFQGEGP